MIAVIISIQAGDGGVAIDQIPFIPSNDPLERQIAGLFDLAFKTLGQHIAEQTRNCLTIEGENIEPLIRKALAGSHLANVRDAMKQAGYKFPGEP